MRPKFLPLVLIVPVLAGCPGTRVIPDNPLLLSNRVQLPVDGVIAVAALGAAAYYVIEPTAPNWEVRTQRLDTSRIEIRLRMKRFTTGGEGEALALLRRRAQKIADDTGAPGYELLSYEESIDSETTLARRVGRGVVRLLPPA